LSAPNIALLDLRDYPQIRWIADRVDFCVLTDDLSDGALAFGDNAVDRSLEFERLSKQFSSLHETKHLAGFDTVIQIKVELNKPAFERARNLGRLVKVVAYATGGPQRHLEVPLECGLGFDRDELEIFFC